MTRLERLAFACLAIAAILNVVGYAQRKAEREHNRDCLVYPAPDPGAYNDHTLLDYRTEAP